MSKKVDQLTDEIIEVAPRPSHIFLNALRSGKRILCPECRKGYFIPIGDCKITHGFYCSECDCMVNID